MQWVASVTLLLIGGLLYNGGDGAKILFISPSITQSIVMFTGTMADVLVKAGHEVTFWIPQVTNTNRINGTKLARIVRTDGLPDVFSELLKHVDFFQESPLPILTRAAVNKALHDICEGILKRTDDLEALRRENFDLAFSDNTEPCFAGLAHHIGAKQHIYISTGEFSDAATWIGGIPQPIGAVPSFEDTLVGPVMSFRERVYNTFMYVTGWLLTAYQFRQQNVLFQRYSRKNFPSLESLLRDSPIWFKASDPFVVPAVPTLDKVVNIAGVGISRYANLSSEFIKLIMRGRKGAVFFSLGTVTPTSGLCEERRRAFFDAFAAFPDYQFIVKVSANDKTSANLARHIANIKLVHWAPQSDLLAHDQVKLFISHGGMNSVLESAIHGKPMIIIPLFFDQFRNAKGVEYRGYGRILDRTQLFTDVVRQLIMEVLHNSKYTINAQRLSRLYWNKPHRPEEEIVRWTNFVLENGPLPELTPQGAYMGLVDYYCLDVFALAVLFGAATLFALLYATFKLFKIIAKICIKTTHVSESKKYK